MVVIGATGSTQAVHLQLQVAHRWVVVQLVVHNVTSRVIGVPVVLAPPSATATATVTVTVGASPSFKRGGMSSGTGGGMCSGTGGCGDGSATR